MEETTWKRFWRACAGGVTERDRRNSRIVNFWALAWASCWVAVSFLVSRELIPAGVASYSAVLVTTALGVGTLLVFVRYLHEAEELQRKIQLEALALGFGVGIVAAVLLEMLAEIGAWEAGPADVILPMVAAYALGTIFGFRRYR